LVEYLTKSGKRDFIGIGLWFFLSEEWKVESEEWRVKNGEWRMES
jgi:hypothetical protein